MKAAVALGGGIEGGGPGAGGPGEGGRRRVPGGQRFEILRRLGAGGMGVVFEARDRVRGQRVALKTLRKVDPTAIYLFKREFRLLAGLRHPNLVTLGELVQDGGRWFFTMELLDGVDFRAFCAPGDAPAGELVTQSAERSRTLDSDSDEITAPESPSRDLVRVPRFDEERVRSALVGLCRGLVALHRAGKVHRDLKPGNVLVTAEGRVVLLDFGLVVHTHEQKTSSQRGSAPWGTPRYMAPEATRGVVGPAADLYAVGVMLYDVLTGRTPFGDSGEPILVAKTLREATPPGELAPDLPPDLEALAIRLLRRDPAERPTAAEVLALLGATLPPSPSVPFLSRARELGALDAALARVRTTRAPAVITVTAEAGLGKTRLVEAWLDRLREGGDVVVLAGASYEDGAVPYQALDSAVDDLADHLAGSPALAHAAEPYLGAASRLFPVLSRARPRSLRGPSTAPAHAPSAVREGVRIAAFDAVAALLRLVAGETPVVLVLDDAHWADADSALLLASLIPTEGLGPVLVVVAHRPAPSHQPLVAAVSLLDVARTSLVLGPLETTLASDDVAALSAALGFEEAEIAPLLQAAAGRPLDLVELLRHPVGAVDDVVGADSGGAFVRAPRTFDEALGRRVNGLPADARALLSILAVSRSPLPLSVAGAASRLPDPQAARDALLSAGMVRVGGTLGPEGLDVAHDRVRTFVLSSLPKPDDREAHHALAEALRRLLPAESDRIADHLSAAGDHLAAEPYLLRAAEAARASLAYGRAADLYARAVDARAKDDPARTALLIERGDAESLAGRGLAAAEAFLEAAPHVSAQDAQDLERRAAEQLLMSGRQREGMRILGNVCRGVGLRAASSPVAALPLFLVESARLSLRGLDEGDPTVPRGPEVDLRVNAARTAARSLSVVDTMTAAYYQRLHLRLSLDTGDPAHLLFAYALSASFAATEEGSNGARTAFFLARGQSLAGRCHNPLRPATLSLTDSVIAYSRGEFDASVAASGEAIRQYRAVGGDCIWDVGSARTFRLLSLGLSGRLPLLAEEADEAEREAALRRDAYTTSFFRTGALPWIALANGDPVAARASLAKAVARHQFPGFSWGVWYAAIHRALIEIQADEPAEAHRALDELRLPPAPLLVSRFRLHRSLSVWARGAVAARALERTPGSLVERAWLRHAIGVLDRDGERYARALSQLLLASSHAADGRPSQAHATWHAAAHALEEAGLRLFAASAFQKAAQSSAGHDGVLRDLERRARVLFEEAAVPAPAALADTLAPGLPLRWRQR